mgnify:CR=1
AGATAVDGTAPDAAFDAGPDAGINIGAARFLGRIG